MSLCRLFEMLLTDPVNQNPKDRNIRTWTMVHELVLLINFKWYWGFFLGGSISLSFSTPYFKTSTSIFFVFSNNCRQLLPSPWCGQWAAPVIQSAERSLVSVSGNCCQGSQKNFHRLRAWEDGNAQYMKLDWCTTISTRYCVIARYYSKCLHFALNGSFTLMCLTQIEGKGRWVHWNDSIERVNLGDKNTKIQDIIVPTIDTVRYSYLMDLCINYEV